MIINHNLKYLYILLILVILFFTACSPKVIPPEISQQPVQETEPGITIKEYLSLQIWEKEQDVFAILSIAEKAEDLEELKNLYFDAVKLFEEIESSFAELELKSELAKMNTLQLEICQLYIESLNNFIQTDDPIELDNLKIADKKMNEFVLELEKVQHL